ncbi:MAG: hypothetical protein AUK54_01695 [Helicobacteraceae bacterium CG2_30_36_10]|nr:MAG: hypothetical protein AUK54_01695 [Helicobacteraceae bacterium CG2_30_36_10]
MKKHIIISFLFLFSVVLSSNELAWVDEQINAIKPPRKGLSNSAVSNLKNPFIFLNKQSTKTVSNKPVSSSPTIASSTAKISKPTTSNKILYLDAIMNKSALISGTWYKTNDSVQGYTILDITRTSVVLTKNSKRLVLSTNSTNQNLKFKNK